MQVICKRRRNGRKKEQKNGAAKRRRVATGKSPSGARLPRGNAVTPVSCLGNTRGAVGGGTYWRGAGPSEYPAGTSIRTEYLLTCDRYAWVCNGGRISVYSVNRSFYDDVLQKISELVRVGRFGGTDVGGCYRDVYNTISCLTRWGWPIDFLLNQDNGGIH